MVALRCVVCSPKAFSLDMPFELSTSFEVSLSSINIFCSYIKLEIYLKTIEVSLILMNAWIRVIVTQLVILLIFVVYAWMHWNLSSLELRCLGWNQLETRARWSQNCLFVITRFASHPHYSIPWIVGSSFSLKTLIDACILPNVLM